MILILCISDFRYLLTGHYKYDFKEQ